eukprot:721218-Hanusia_phi.AAC.1
MNFEPPPQSDRATRRTRDRTVGPVRARRRPRPQAGPWPQAITVTPVIFVIMGILVKASFAYCTVHPVRRYPAGPRRGPRPHCTEGATVTQPPSPGRAGSAGESLSGARYHNDRMPGRGPAITAQPGLSD